MQEALGVGCTAGGFRVSRDLSSAIYKVWVFVGFTAEDFMQKEHWANVSLGRLQLQREANVRAFISGPS